MKPRPSKEALIKSLEEIADIEKRTFPGVLGNPVTVAGRWGLKLSKSYRTTSRIHGKPTRQPNPTPAGKADLVVAVTHIRAKGQTAESAGPQKLAGPKRLLARKHDLLKTLLQVQAQIAKLKPGSKPRRTRHSSRRLPVTV